MVRAGPGFSTNFLKPKKEQKAFFSEGVGVFWAADHGLL